MVSNGFRSQIKRAFTVVQKLSKMSPAARINVAHSSADGCTSTKSRRSTSHNCARQRISVAAKASFRHDLVKKTAAMTAGVLISSQIAGKNHISSMHMAFLILRMEAIRYIASSFCRPS